MSMNLITLKNKIMELKISKKKLKEWEIPMNLSDNEKKMYGMTIRDRLDNTAKPKKKK